MMHRPDDQGQHLPTRHDFGIEADALESAPPLPSGKNDYQAADGSPLDETVP